MARFGWRDDDGSLSFCPRRARGNFRLTPDLLRKSDLDSFFRNARRTLFQIETGARIFDSPARACVAWLSKYQSATPKIANRNPVLQGANA
jgi:hypothetical protein